MNVGRRLIEELRSVGLAALFFWCWIAAMISIKRMILAEYDIAFSGISAALIGAVVLSKVVIVLEHVHLGRIRTQPAWVDLIARTLLYATGVFVVLLLEKAFEGRQEHGGFLASLAVVFEHPDMPHVWVNTIGLTGALLLYNLHALIRKHFGHGVLLRLLRQPAPEEGFK